MTAGYNHLGKSDACFHPLGAVGEAHVKRSTSIHVLGGTTGPQKQRHSIFWPGAKICAHNTRCPFLSSLFVFLCLLFLSSSGWKTGGDYLSVLRGESWITTSTSSRRTLQHRRFVS